MPDASQDHEHHGGHDHGRAAPTVTSPAAPTARKAEPHGHGAHEHRHGPGVPCTCGRDCLSCQEAALSVTCGCDFEAKQFEYNLDRRIEDHAHHAAGHGVAEAHDHDAMMTDPRFARFMEADMRRRFLWSLLLTIPAVLYSPLGANIFRVSLPRPIPANWILFILTTPVVFWTGSIFVTGAYRSLRKRTLNMSVLVSVGVLAAYLFSVVITALNAGETFYEAAAMLVTFVLFGHWMEMRSRRGTSDALQALFNLVPPKARVVRDGTVVEVPTSEIRPGDIVELRPGDRVPVDGIVTEGETAIDEALVTGESIPVPKGSGDQVTGGTINQSGSVRFKATKVGDETALAQIVKLVEEAQASKAPGQRLADRWAQYLVILAVGAGIITFGIWYGVVGESLLVALTFAISAVVIACPDALGLATPTAVAVGTGLGAAAEARSGHPLSKAVMEEAERRGITVDQTITGFENLAGHGVRATVVGRDVLVGTAKLMRDRGIDLGPVQSDLQRLLGEGKTLMIVAADGRVAGMAAAADPVRPTSRRAVEGLQRLGVEVAMITGDNRPTAEAVGGQLGITRVFAEVLPEQKADYVKRLRPEWAALLMSASSVIVATNAVLLKRAERRLAAI